MEPTTVHNGAVVIFDSSLYMKTVTIRRDYYAMRSTKNSGRTSFL